MADVSSSWRRAGRAARDAAVMAGGMLGGVGGAVRALCPVGIAMNGLLVALGLSRARGQSS
jgi:hypothetical protein